MLNNTYLMLIPLFSSCRICSAGIVWKKIFQKNSSGIIGTLLLLTSDQYWHYTLRMNIFSRLEKQMEFIKK